jgi:hypothetical protein
MPDATSTLGAPPQAGVPQVQPGDPGTYVGRDGNWYDAQGNSLGPSGQAPTPTAKVQPVPSVQPGAAPPSAPTTPATNPLAPFSETFTPPSGNAPLPAIPGYAPFQAPTVADALNDPGYQFTQQQGQAALQNWAAAKGTLNDSETADALIGYGQGLASTQYGNVYNRAAQTYNTNLGPQLAQWNAQIGQNNLGYSNAWTQFLQDYNQYLNRFNTTVNNASAP